MEEATTLQMRRLTLLAPYQAAFVTAASVETTLQELNKEKEQGEGKTMLMMLLCVTGIE